MIFDAHSDTMYEIMKQGYSFRKNNLHIDMERLEKYGEYIQVFAAFVDTDEIDCTPKEQVDKIISVYMEETEKNGINRCKNANEIQRGEINSILSIEGGEALMGSLENLENYAEQGVKIITLTWNHNNEISHSITSDEGLGLTAFGKKLVREMNKKGIIIDLSHISVQGFWDTLAITEKPVIASHSCVKSLCNHSRNLSDEQIKAIIKNRGVIGVNFYADFLSEENCTTDKILEHVDYIIASGGVENVGLGSDFDGMERLPEGMTGIESMKNLTEAIYKKYGKEAGEKIVFGNFLRVLKENSANL
ncbi:MAG: dipeptidase [Clostridia bacterium]|nr:dipeptidase [Clostridia bacterium]